MCLRSRGVTTGWSGMPPYTQHRAEAWFANQQGEVQKRARTTGYNAAAGILKQTLKHE